MVKPISKYPIYLSKDITAFIVLCFCLILSLITSLFYNYLLFNDAMLIKLFILSGILLLYFMLMTSFLLLFGALFYSSTISGLLTLATYLLFSTFSSGKPLFMNACYTKHPNVYCNSIGRAFF